MLINVVIPRQYFLVNKWSKKSELIVEGCTRITIWVILLKNIAGVAPAACFGKQTNRVHHIIPN
jgi:hypothetical protein